MVKVLFTVGTWPETLRTADTAILMETERGFSLVDATQRHPILSLDRVDEVSVAMHPEAGDILTIWQNGTLYTILPILYTNPERTFIVPSLWHLRHLVAGFKNMQKRHF